MGHHPDSSGQTPVLLPLCVCVCVCVFVFLMHCSSRALATLGCNCLITFLSFLLDYEVLGIGNQELCLYVPCSGTALSRLSRCVCVRENSLGKPLAMAEV